MALRLNGSTSGYVELNAPAVAGSTALTVPYGIVQIVSENYTSRFASTGTNPSGWETITNFNATITPKFSSSKILVMVNIGVTSNNYGDTSSAFRIRRGSSTVLVGNTSGSRDAASFRTMSGMNQDHGWSIGFLGEDSPGSTSALTYSIQVNSQDNSICTINYEQRNNNNGDAYSMDCLSNMTLMEVAA